MSARLRSLLSLLFSSAVFVAVIYTFGSRIQFESMPDIRSRVLSLTTTVPEGYVSVVEAIDGDTIVVKEGGEERTVRLLGVDTPETKDPRRAVQCFGHEASKYTKSLVTGRAVRLVIDPAEGDKDKYGRLLRYVYFEDGTMLNDRLVYEGYAFAYEKFPTARTEVLKKMEKDARDNNRGLWGGCDVTVKDSGKQKSTNSLRE